MNFTLPNTERIDGLNVSQNQINNQYIKSVGNLKIVKSDSATGNSASPGEDNDEAGNVMFFYCCYCCFNLVPGTRWDALLPVALYLCLNYKSFLFSV